MTSSAVAVSAPVRVDLAGGVTDVPQFSRLVGTTVTNVAIDLFADDVAATPLGIRVRVAASVDGSLVVREAGRPTPVDGTANREANLPVRLVEGLISPAWQAGAVVDVWNGLPRRTGLGASSSLAVCLAVGLHALTATATATRSSLDHDANVLVKQAHHAEVVTAGIVGGFQDFIAAFFGSVNHITFSALEETDLARQRGLLGVGIPEDMRRYLDANLIVIVRTRETISSNTVVDDHVRSLAAHPEEFVRHLRRIKASNAQAFPLLTEQRGALDDRVQHLGAIMTTSWDERKSLSSMVGGGSLADVEAAVRPLCLGLHGPGSGVNSLLLLTTPHHRDRVVNTLAAFRPDVAILYVRINTTGALVERVEPEAALGKNASFGRHA
jgi:galactokinase/mevalonate kinase-like predicted kinase